MSYNSAYVSNNGDMSQASCIGGPIDLRAAKGIVAIVANYSGAPNGTLQLQGQVGNPTSAGQGPGVGAGGTWPTSGWVPMGSAVVVSAAGSYIWDIGPTGVDAVQVVYTKSSGTGTLTCGFNTKGT